MSELLNSSPMVFPVLECIHIFGFILLAGAIALVDFRLLFGVMPAEGPPDLAHEVMPWSLIGLGLALTSGALLFASDPDHYYLNHAFQIKIAVLVVALGFDHTIHKRILKPGASQASRTLAASLSLALWSVVIGGGIFIGFINGPE